MEEFQRLRQEADQALQVADHMLTVTYPLVQDTKLLLSVTINLYKGMTKGVSAILSYERLFKRIPPYPESFYPQLQFFKARCTRRYNLNPEYLQLMEKLHEIVEMHKHSPIEFRRQDKFVICSDNYRLSTITLQQLKEYLAKAKLFIAEVHRMVGKYERIFR